jgi:hypothetical protein
MNDGELSAFPGGDGIEAQGAHRYEKEVTQQIAFAALQELLRGARSRR